MSESSVMEGAAPPVKTGDDVDFKGAVVGCCFGRDGQDACQCDPVERAVRGVRAGRSRRSLTSGEREVVVGEAVRTGVLGKESCTGLEDRELAVAVAGAWDAWPRE